MSFEQKEKGERYKKLRGVCAGISDKIGEMVGEKHEHELALEAMRKVEAGRPCFRLVGGVLVQRTAGEVIPSLEANLKNIEQVIAAQTKNLEEKEKALAEFMRDNNIVVRGDEILIGE